MLKVLKPGFYTTVQDTGRFGYRDIGVPVSGVMDNKALAIANSLLENEEDAAVLEITMTGPTLEFEEKTYIALSGAIMNPTLNNNPIVNNKVYRVQEKDILSYGRLDKGLRSYLAIKGGWQTKKVLGSRSYFKAITLVECVADHTEIPYIPCASFEPKIPEMPIESHFEEKVLQVSKGPEYALLLDRQLEKIFGNEFKVAKDYNRMAYQLMETVAEHNINMLTSATLPGTVQLTPSGKLIILMKDGQTTGGYPRILQLSDDAIALLSQKKMGDSISFKLM
ncbi:MAG: biotin-dependent carboxyltransferase family protein [Maribacter sp.]|nr:biotin-dependent carboxyltransferase family protein [Maribacter sp.]